MSKKKNFRTGSRADNSSRVRNIKRGQQLQTGSEKDGTKRRRNRNKMDPTLVICLGVGVLFVFGAVIVVYGNYKPPSGAPVKRAQVKTIVEKRDSNGNLLTDAQVEAIKRHNEQIKKENKERKNRKKKRKVSSTKNENKVVNIAAQRFAEQYGEETQNGSTTSVSNDSQSNNAPVPGWARDSRGKSIISNTDNTNNQANNTQNNNPPINPRRHRKSPLAPWKQADGRE